MYAYIGISKADLAVRVVLDSDFSGWLDSDLCDNPDDSILSQLKYQIW